MVYLRREYDHRYTRSEWCVGPRDYLEGTQGYSRVLEVLACCKFHVLRRRLRVARAAVAHAAVPPAATCGSSVAVRVRGAAGCRRPSPVATSPRCNVAPLQRRPLNDAPLQRRHVATSPVASSPVASSPVASGVARTRRRCPFRAQAAHARRRLLPAAVRAQHLHQLGRPDPPAQAARGTHPAASTLCCCESPLSLQPASAGGTFKQPTGT